jgi:GT2 family glycosyltransferase
VSIVRLQVAVIVLNWNREDDTLRCLASLVETSTPLSDVVLVDNASTDGTIEAVRRTYPAVQIIENATNLGYAAGNNVGIEYALESGYDAVLLLNNDTVVAPDAIDELVKPLVENPRIGISGSAIAYLAEPERVWSAGGSIHRADGVVTSDWQDRDIARLPNGPYRVDHLSGCCMLVRSQAIRECGMLDPRFFMYFEETEWCERVAQRGWEIVVVPSSRILHAIDPTAQSGSPSIAYYMTRNHLLFLRATHAPASAWFMTVLRQVRTVISLTLRPHTEQRKRGRTPMCLAMRDFALGRFGPFRPLRS